MTIMVAAVQLARTARTKMNWIITAVVSGICFDEDCRTEDDVYSHSGSASNLRW